MPETTKFSPGKSPEIEGALQANSILLARYKIIGVLGGGGQGAVYQARDTRFKDAKRLVAVKQINYPAEVGAKESAMKAFKRESNILATLAHPAIPRIYDYFDQGEHAYLVMEYINGSDLEMLINKTKQLPVKKVIEWGIELCDVLEYLHNHEPQPIIFRDIKPANIMIDSFGRARLIDFGIAKIFVSGAKQTMIGTEGYSAPEQYRGNASPLSDVFSLGATLHHVLTRQDPRLAPPFSFAERPIANFNPDAPAKLQKILDKAISFNESDRYQSCLAMKADLESVLYASSSSASASAPAHPVSTSMPSGMLRDSALNVEEGMGTVAFSEGGNSTQIIEPVWTFKTEDEIRANPTYFRGAVIVGSYDTNVWAINSENGELIWKYPTEGGISSSPAVDHDNRLVLFGSEDQRFHAVDYRTGRVNWTFATDDKIRGAPNVSHGHVFFGSDDGKLYALVSGNGRLLWEYDTEFAVRSRPYVTNNLIVFGTEGGDLMALELSGERKWSFRTRRSVTSSPFVDEHELSYVGSFDNFLYAVEISSGYSVWRCRTNGPIVSSPVVKNNIVYFGSADKTFYAVNADSGKVKWRFETENSIVGSPLWYQENIYFGGTDGKLYCLDAKSGDERWSFQTDGPITSRPCVAEDTLIVCSMDHTIYALPIVG